jgi:hypothetical protein
MAMMIRRVALPTRFCVATLNTRTRACLALNGLPSVTQINLYFCKKRFPRFLEAISSQDL